MDVTLYGRNAEIAQDYLSKGKPVFLEGRLSTSDTWDDKETGQKRSKLKIDRRGPATPRKSPARRVHGGGSNQGQGQGQGQPRSQAQGSQGQRSQGGGGGGQRPPQQPPPGGENPQQPQRPTPTHEEDGDIPF